MSAPTDLAAPLTHRNQPGFLLWVGVDPQDRRHHAAEIIELAEALGELARELLPTAETFTALSLGETSAGGARAEDLGALRDRLAALEVIAHTPLWSSDQAAGTASSSGTAPSSRVRIDLPSRRVVVDGAEQKLTYKEFELLSYLVTAAGRVVARTELFASVWRTGTTDASSRTIDVHVRRLRDKLGLHDQIITVRGAGYRFEHAERVDVVALPLAG